MYYQFRNKTYTLVSQNGERVAIEPVPNPELVTEYVSEKVFFAEAKPLPQVEDSKKKAVEKSAPEDQQKINRRSDEDQPKIKSRSTEDQPKISPRSFFFKIFSDENFEKNENTEKEVKKGGVSPRSIAALDKARTAIAKDPFAVVSEYWTLIQWLDAHYGLEKLEKQASFPRRLRQRANENLGLQKSLGFYYNLVRYYSGYKKQIPVPIWFIKFEYWFEKNIFTHLID